MSAIPRPFYWIAGAAAAGLLLSALFTVMFFTPG